MSQELIEFSELIDEQFEIEIDLGNVEPDNFWNNIVNLFIWNCSYRFSSDGSRRQG